MCVTCRNGIYTVWVCETKDRPEYEAGVQDCLFLLQRPLHTFVNIRILFLENMYNTITLSLSVNIAHARARGSYTSVCVCVRVGGVGGGGGDYPKLHIYIIYINLHNLQPCIDAR